MSDFVDIKTAFAAKLSPVPVFYRYDELVLLYRVNYSDTTKLQYKIGENGEWIDYSVPFAIPAQQTTKVYARIGTTGRITYMNFSTTDEALGVHTESNTDFEFSYVSLSKRDKNNSTKGFGKLSLFWGFHQSSFVLYSFIHKLTSEYDKFLC